MYCGKISYSVQSKQQSWINCTKIVQSEKLDYIVLIQRGF